MIYIVKDFSVVNEADVSLIFSRFFYDPVDHHSNTGYKRLLFNLISASGAFVCLLVLGVFHPNES